MALKLPLSIRSAFLFFQKRLLHLLLQKDINKNKELFEKLAKQ